MNKKRWTLLAVLLWIIAAALPASAQQYRLPGPIALVNGDLWMWSVSDNRLERLTEWTYNGHPIMSPDGTKVVYLSVAEQGLNELSMPGAPPSNIWMMDLNSYTNQAYTFERLADQQSGVRRRSFPVWSPDSTRLAWSELSGTEYNSTANLVVYDLRTRQSRIISSQYSMGFQDGGVWMPPVKWGPSGISRVLFTYTDQTDGMGAPVGQFILEIYNPDNGDMRSYTVGNTSSPDSIVLEHMWVSHQGQDVIALATRAGTWSVFDSFTGARTALSSPPSLHVRMGVGATLLTPIANLGNDGLTWNWQATFLYDGGVPSRTVMLPYNAYALQDWALPAISGSYDVAWNDGGNVYLWRNGGEGSPVQIMSSANNQNPYNLSAPGVVWLPLVWTTGGTINPAPAPQPVPVGCNMAPRLTPGQAAQVTPGAPNNMRTSPTLSSRVLGVLPAGTTMTVLQGPVCADGYQWWYVQIPELRGWTAEGINGNYWLNPVN